MARYDNGNSTQELIVKTAKKLFLERGVDNTSTMDVANNSHVARNSVRYYFKTKKDMHRAVTDDMLNRLADIIIQKLQLEKLTWVIMSFAFWYRFYEDTQFRKYNLECIGKVEGTERDYHYIYEFMHRCFSGDLTYEEFVEKYYLSMEIGADLQESLMKFFAARLDQTDYKEAAANELLLYLRLYGIPDALIQARIDDALEILPSLDLEQMGKAMG